MSLLVGMDIGHVCTYVYAMTTITSLSIVQRVANPMWENIVNRLAELQLDLENIDWKSFPEKCGTLNRIASVPYEERFSKAYLPNNVRTIGSYGK